MLDTIAIFKAMIQSIPAQTLATMLSEEQLVNAFPEIVISKIDVDDFVCHNNVSDIIHHIPDDEVLECVDTNDLLEHVASWVNLSSTMEALLNQHSAVSIVNHMIESDQEKIDLLNESLTDLYCDWEEYFSKFGGEDPKALVGVMLGTVSSNQLLDVTRDRVDSWTDSIRADFAKFLVGALEQLDSGDFDSSTTQKLAQVYTDLTKDNELLTKSASEDSLLNLLRATATELLNRK
jgi:hypothetical protein